MTEMQLKAIKLLEALAADHTSDAEHDWRNCLPCVAAMQFQIDHDNTSQILMREILSFIRSPHRTLSSPSGFLECEACRAKPDNPQLCASCIQNRDTIDSLQTAVRKHRDQQGDDRCWMDDEELYAVLPEGYIPPQRDTAVELKNCRLFIASRQHPTTIYISPQREIEWLRRAARDVKDAITTANSSELIDLELILEKLNTMTEGQS